MTETNLDLRGSIERLEGRPRVYLGPYLKQTVIASRDRQA